MNYILIAFTRLISTASFNFDKDMTVSPKDSNNSTGAQPGVSSDHEKKNQPGLTETYESCLKFNNEMNKKNVNNSLFEAYKQNYNEKQGFINTLNQKNLELEKLYKEMETEEFNIMHLQKSKNLEKANLELMCLDKIKNIKTLSSQINFLKSKKNELKKRFQNNYETLKRRLRNYENSSEEYQKIKKELETEELNFSTELAKYNQLIKIISDELLKEDNSYDNFSIAKEKLEFEIPHLQHNFLLYKKTMKEKRNQLLNSTENLALEIEKRENKLREIMMNFDKLEEKSFENYRLMQGTF